MLRGAVNRLLYLEALAAELGSLDAENGNEKIPEIVENCSNVREIGNTAINTCSPLSYYSNGVSSPSNSLDTTTGSIGGPIDYSQKYTESDYPQYYSSEVPQNCPEYLINYENMAHESMTHENMTHNGNYPQLATSEKPIEIATNFQSVPTMTAADLFFQEFEAELNE